MALTQISRVASTSGDTWISLMTGPATVTSLVLANKTVGPSRVSVRINKGATQALLVPDDEIAHGGSSRLRLPSIVLEAGDSLQVKSIGGVDWTASGVTIVE
jgi:hypothetical protein